MLKDFLIKVIADPVDKSALEYLPQPVLVFPSISGPISANVVCYTPTLNKNLSVLGTKLVIH